jgi:hypothetical protein
MGSRHLGGFRNGLLLSITLNLSAHPAIPHFPCRPASGERRHSVSGYSPSECATSLLFYNCNRAFIGLLLTAHPAIYIFKSARNGREPPVSVGLLARGL